MKELLLPAPGRSRFRQLNPRRLDPNRSRNKSDRDIKLFHTGNLVKQRPCISLFHDVQSTDDSFAREDKGKEMKPRTRPSSADGSEHEQYNTKHRQETARSRKRPDRIWDPTSLLKIGYRRCVPGGQNTHVVK